MTKKNAMERYSNKEGDIIKNPNGGWVIFGTEQEIKEWMRKHARSRELSKVSDKKNR